MKSCSLIGRSICASSSTGFIISFLIGHRHCLFCWWPVILQFWRVKLPFPASSLWSLSHWHFWETAITFDPHLHYMRWTHVPPVHAGAEPSIMLGPVCFPGLACDMCYTDWLSHRQQCTSTASVFVCDPLGVYMCCVASDPVRFPL